jgi:hypothetical protein
MAAKKRKIDVTEFRAWLEGVEEMQGPEWVPNLEQWQRIREKIDSIREDAPVPKQQRAEQPAPQQQRPVQYAQPAPQYSTLGAEPQRSQPIPRQTQPGGMIKTPDLDTGDGTYESGFA